jgi:hypothetical protein
VIGLICLLSIVYTERDGITWANVESVLKQNLGKANTGVQFEGTSINASNRKVALTCREILERLEERGQLRNVQLYRLWTEETESSASSGEDGVSLRNRFTVRGMKQKRKPKQAADSLRVRLPRGPKKRRPGHPCWLCNHPKLREATADIAAGMTTREVGKKYGCSAMAVSKHVRHHMYEALLQTDLTQTVLDQLRNLQRRTDRILAKAEEAEDLVTALKGVHEARENLLGIARLTGEDKSAQKAEPTRVEIIYVDKQLVVQQGDTGPPVIEAAADDV